MVRETRALVTASHFRLVSEVVELGFLLAQGRPFCQPCEAWVDHQAVTVPLLG